MECVGKTCCSCIFKTLTLRLVRHIRGRCREIRGTLRLPPSAFSINIEPSLARRLLVKVVSGREFVVLLPAQLAAAAVNSGKHCGSVELCLFTA